MLAFGLALALFFYFLLVGTAVVRSLHASRSMVQDLLMAPAVGVVASVIPVFFINRMIGMPVGRFGPALVIALVILSIAVLVIRALRLRRAESLDGLPAATFMDLSRQAWRRDWHYLPFLGILLVATVLIGRPMFEHGFDWLSFCNNDMANYCLSAEWFLRNGFLDAPAASTLINGTDYSQTYWFFHVPSMARAGSELLISLTCSVTGLSAHEAFMPLIVTFHVTLISAASATILSSDDRRSAALVACCLLAASAQVTFGTVYQLIAQDIGLAVLCVNATLIIRTFESVGSKALIRHGALLGIGMSGQFLIYPEVNPFLAGGFVVFLIAMAIRRRLPIKPLLIVLAIGGVGTVVLLNSYIYDALAFMYNQRTQAAGGDDPRSTLFPFFLIPSGFANLWGLVQITSMPPEPGFSIAIVIGALLTLTALVAAFWMSSRGEPAAAITLVCAALSAVLLRNYAGFGLYKMAMFVQPFMLPTLALAGLLVARRYHKPSLVWVLVLLALPSARVQHAYVTYSADGGGSTFSEVLGATRTKILDEIRGKLAEAESKGIAPPNGHVLVDSYNISLTKIISAYTRGRATAFPSSTITLQAAIPNAPPEHTRQSYLEQARELSRDTFKNVHEVFFEFDPARGRGPLSAKFYFYDQGGRPSGRPDGPDTLLVAGTSKISMFNRRTFGDSPGNFAMLPLGAVRNHLLFVQTFMSHPYYKAGDATYISVYQLERDPIFYVDQTMAGVGRYFVFEVLNPDEEVRLCLDMTMTLKSDGNNKLPVAHVVGTERKPFPLVGRGACRVFSPPIKPQVIRGRYYVGLDMGEFGTQFRVGRTGLMSFFGQEVRLDRRLLVGFGRDISVIGNDEYENLRPPSAIRVWGTSHSELRHHDIEFSGFYEDGWVAESGYLTLGQEPDRTKLVLRGFVAKLQNPAFSTRLTIMVDGEPVTFTGKTSGSPIVDGKLVVGPYELVADVPHNGARRRKIELQWSAVQQLMGLDTRKAAARVENISFEKPN